MKKETKAAPAESGEVLKLSQFKTLSNPFMHHPDNMLFRAIGVNINNDNLFLFQRLRKKDMKVIGFYTFEI